MAVGCATALNSPAGGTLGGLTPASHTTGEMLPALPDGCLHVLKPVVLSPWFSAVIVVLLSGCLMSQKFAHEYSACIGQSGS